MRLRQLLPRHDDTIDVEHPIEWLLAELLLRDALGDQP